MSGWLFWLVVAVAVVLQIYWLFATREWRQKSLLRRWRRP